MTGEITGESIKSAMSLKIKNNFAVTSGVPPATTYPKIYKEQIVQGMKKPCFFVLQMDVSQEKLFGNTYERVYQMSVRYHPEEYDLNTYETLADIGNRLLEYLTTIEVPILARRYDTDNNPIEDVKPVKGSQMSFKITEDVLQMFVTYVVRMKMVKAETSLMETLDINN